MMKLVEQKKRELLDEMSGASLDAVSAGRDAITLTLVKDVSGTLTEYRVSTYGRVGRSGELFAKDQAATAAALPDLYRRIGVAVASVAELRAGLYEVALVDGSKFEISDIDRFSDYTMHVDVSDRRTSSKRDLVLYD